MLVRTVTRGLRRVQELVGNFWLRLFRVELGVDAGDSFFEDSDHSTQVLKMSVV